MRVRFEILFYALLAGAFLGAALNERHVLGAVLGGLFLLIALAGVLVGDSESN